VYILVTVSSMVDSNKCNSVKHLSPRIDLRVASFVVDKSLDTTIVTEYVKRL